MGTLLLQLVGVEHVTSPLHQLAHGRVLARAARVIACVVSIAVVAAATIGVARAAIAVLVGASIGVVGFAIAVLVGAAVGVVRVAIAVLVGAAVSVIRATISVVRAAIGVATAARTIVTTATRLAANTAVLLLLAAAGADAIGAVLGRGVTSGLQRSASSRWTIVVLTCPRLPDVSSRPRPPLVP